MGRRHICQCCLQEPRERFETFMVQLGSEKPFISAPNVSQLWHTGMPAQAAFARLLVQSSQSDSRPAIISLILSLESLPDAH